MSGLSEHIQLLIERGGYVMIPLIALSIVSFAVIFERAWFWLSTHRTSRTKWLMRLNNELRHGRTDVARKIIARDSSPYGDVSRGLLDRGASDAVAIELVEMQRPRLDRFMATLSVIITAAPLLGILGTVVGIIQSFQVLAAEQTLTEPKVVAEGIAAALLTTALGLVVALLTLFPYTVFRSQVDRAMGRLESMVAAAQQGHNGATRQTDAAEPVARLTGTSP